MTAGGGGGEQTDDKLFKENPFWVMGVAVAGYSPSGQKKGSTVGQK